MAAIRVGTAVAGHSQLAAARVIPTAEQISAVPRFFYPLAERVRMAWKTMLEAQDLAIPSNRIHAIPPFAGRDGDLAIGALKECADGFWILLLCTGDRGCHHVFNLAIPRAIARFGPAETLHGIERRFRCPSCGGRTIRATLHADTGLPPQTR